MTTSEAERDLTKVLFEEYERTGDPAVRQRLVATNLRLAQHCARRFANRGIPLDDLEQVASLALIGAIDRFQPGRGLEFSTFATPTIMGELKRHFRDRGWSVRVPRRIQELHLRLTTVVGDLTHENGRSPSIAEIAHAAQASEEEVLEAMDAALAYRSESIDVPGARSDAMGVDDDALFAAENRMLVEELLASLPPRDRLLLQLRYFEEMSQDRIAERLGVSQMHVSRLLARCIVELRRRHQATADRRNVG